MRVSTGIFLFFIFFPFLSKVYKWHLFSAGKLLIFFLELLRWKVTFPFALYNLLLRINNGDLHLL